MVLVPSGWSTYLTINASARAPATVGCVNQERHFGGVLASLRGLPEFDAAHAFHGVDRDVDHLSQLRLFHRQPHSEPPQILSRRVLVTHGVFEQPVNQRAPRHARVGAMRGRVGGDDPGRVVVFRILRSRHARDVMIIRRDRGD